MTQQKTKILKHLIIIFPLLTSLCFAEFDARQEIIKFMEGRKELGKYLTAPVTVTQDKCGCLLIKDEGIFAFQYELLRPEGSADPNVAIDENVKIHPEADKLVMVVHGWMDKGERGWPSDMAAAIAERTDPNEWVCGSYDWKGGSVVFTSIQAAEYARDVAGPRLARAILATGRDFKHIHLIGHSAGSWAINSAAKRLAFVNRDVQVHLTFLDAYVPSQWNEDLLGRVFLDPERQKEQYWADHYYTKDITFIVTEHDLKYAHNVDISAVDPLISEHEFPYRWYLATITGHYTRWDEKNEPVYIRSGGIDYGFVRSFATGPGNWTRSRLLKLNNPAVKMEKNMGSE